MPRRPIKTATADIDEVIRYPDGCYAVGTYYPAGQPTAKRLLMRVAANCRPPQPDQLRDYDRQYQIWYCDYAPPRAGNRRPPQRMPEIKRWECVVTTRDRARRTIITHATNDDGLRAALATLTDAGGTV